MDGSAVRRFGTALTACTAFTATLSAQTPALPTIKPGMTEAQVRTEWGAPLTVRSAGRMSYMYYTNDWLKRCGTYDIVFLEGVLSARRGHENGHALCFVINAVRYYGHQNGAHIQSAMDKFADRYKTKAS